MAISHWLSATRPKTLAAGIIPVAVGSVLGAHSQNAGSTTITDARFNWLVFACCLIGALCIQIACNFSNDALDALKGADTETRVGPRRAVASGLISASSMLLASLILLLITFAIGLYLASIGGWAIFILGTISIICAYVYTGGPYPLAYLGLGDLFVFLFFGLFAVLGSAYLQQVSLDPATQALPSAWWLIASAIGLQATAIIAVNNLRDRATDSLVQKRTLAVRLGDKNTRIYISLLHVGACACLGSAALLLDNNYIIMSAAIAGFGGLGLSLAIARHSGKQLNRFLGLTAALELITGISIAVCISL